MASYTQLTKYNWQVVISLGYDENGKKEELKNKVLEQKKKLKFLLQKL